MASISPTSVRCADEPHSSKNAYLKLTITSISDSNASTNERYIGWKLTVEGTPWVALYAYRASLGGVLLTENLDANVTKWSAGQTIKSGTKTFNNDSSGNLTLKAYVKQLFYLYYNASRWSSVPSKAQEASVNMVCSQLPRYANLTKYEIGSTEINKFTINWNADAACDAVQYSLNGGNWTNTSGFSFSVSGLTPGQQYNIRIRVKRTDSQLWTTSDYLYPTCKSLPITNTPSNFNIGSNLTASISSTNYLSKWFCDIYDGSTKIGSSGDVTTTSKTVTLTDSTMINNMLSRHSSDNEWNITVKYYCVSNGTQYTLTERTCKCAIPSNSYLPTFNESNISYIVTDSQTNDLTGSNKKVIKGISDIKVTCTKASPQGQATISKYTATSGTSTNTTTDTSSPVINLTNVNANSMSVQAIDSRNKSKNVTKYYDTFIDYFAPTLSSANVARADGVGANINVNLTGKYCNWSGLATTNAMQQVSLQYKLKGASQYTTISGVNLTITNNNGNFTVSGLITGNLFNATNEYDLLITLKDKLNNLTYLCSIPTGKALLWRDLTNSRLGIGKKPAKTLDVNGNINSDFNIYASGDVVGKVRNRAVASIGSDVANSNGWYKVASSTMSSYGNTDITLLVQDNYSMNSKGILNINMRSDNTKLVCYSLTWLSRDKGISPGDAIIVINGMTWTLYFYRRQTRYGRMSFHLLSHTNINGYEPLYNVSFYLNNTTRETTTPTATVTSTDTITNIIYPVGSIYISYKSTSPATLFGGKWEQLKNHFLFATNATSGDKGGYGNGTGTSSGSTTLTAAQSGLPSHQHALQNANPGGTTVGWTSHGVDAVTNKGYTGNVRTGYTGGLSASEGHTHTIPYIEVYVWRRTA